MLRSIRAYSIILALISTQAMATVYDNKMATPSNGNSTWLTEIADWLQKYVLQNPSVADAICQKFPQYESVCRMMVGDTKAQAQALRLCQSLFVPDEVNRCLKVVGQNSFNQSSVRFCGSFFVPDEKIRCLETVRNEMFQPDALNVCSGLFVADEKLSCVNVVRRKVYLPVELNTCRSIFIPDSKIQCLSNTGTRIGNQ